MMLRRYVSISRQCPCVLLLLTSACSANGPAENQVIAVGGNQAAAQVAGSPYTDDDLQYYPIENYLKYPTQVRHLIRRNEMEDGRCRGRGEDIREKYRACNRRLRLLIELERRGWCWCQRVATGQIGMNDHWLPCSEDPTYRPGRIENATFSSEEEINGLAQP